MTLAKALQVAAGNSQESADVAEAIDFDGTNDFLSRASGLSGLSDGKTFTLSFWVWLKTESPYTRYVICNTGTTPIRRFYFAITGTSLQFRGYTAAGAVTLQGSSGGPLPIQTWCNVLISFDMTSQAKARMYFNDVSNIGGFNAYENNAIDFTDGGYNIGAFVSTDPLTYAEGRLANVYFDRVYRDFSIEANRRLFITADLKPAADQAALNPILYLPMDDPTAPGVNAGTGGDFTLTGTVARSGRGPNQYNAPYSDFDGSADYLSRTTALTGIADGKTFTLSFVVNMDATISNYEAFTIRDGANQRLYVRFQSPSSLSVAALDSSPAYALLFTNVQPSGGWVAGRNYHVVMSFDVSNTGKRWVYINGEAASVTYTNYANLNIDFLGASPDVRVGSGAGSFMNGRLGALWFNTSYIDLSVADNLAKFVTGTGIDAKPVDLGASGELPTGTAPIIYLPMYGNNAGKNYGTGGDFTVNSGPYTGARGPNEFWGNKANFDGGTSSLRRSSALTGIADTKTASCSFWVNPGGVSGGEYWLYMDNGAGSLRGFVVTFSNTNLRLQAYNASGTQIFEAYVNSPAWGAGSPFYVQMSFDLANSARRSFYVNGTAASVSWSPYTNQDMSFTAASRVWFGGDGTFYPPGYLSEFYFTTDYIDFTQEANRLKFLDAFGNPVNLTQQIEDAAIPNPAIYMRFPPTSFGTNSGTGGDFTVNGTITDGGQL